MDLLNGMNQLLRRYLVARGVRSGVTTVRGHALHHYALEGTGPGPTVVLVHGLGGSANGFYRILHPLAARFRRVLVPDLPGNGFSLLPPGKALATEPLLEVLQGYLEQEAGEPVFLIGNSLGGAMVATVAARSPDAVRALGLVSPAGARVSDARTEELFRVLRPTSVADARALTRRLFHRPPVTTWLLASDMQRTYTAESVRAILDDRRPPFIEPELLGALSRPTLLIWGESEKLLPYEGIEYFRAHLPPHAEVQVVPGFGHVPQMERPRELVQRLVAFANRSGL